MSERVIPPTTYYTVFGGLIVLTLVTVGISFIPLGPWHTIVGLSIAAVKAALVALFFMHLYYSRQLNWIFIGSGLFWLGILIVLTVTDYVTRS